jgi:hypothetical protein
MKLLVIVLFVCGFAFIYTQHSTPKQIMQKIEQEFKREVQEVKGPGKDKDLIGKLKHVVDVLTNYSDKMPPEHQDSMKKLIGVLQAKHKKMESSGKFDESELEISKDM